MRHRPEYYKRNRSIRRFIVTHYDFDHFCGSSELIPLAEVVYDHESNNTKPKLADYLAATEDPAGLIDVEHPCQERETRSLMKRLYSQVPSPCPQLMLKVALETLNEQKFRGQPVHPCAWGAFVAMGDWRRN